MIMGKPIEEAGLSFADDVHEATTAPTPPKLCKTGVWLESISDRDRAAFAAYVADNRPITTLHQIAVQNGCTAAETRFRSHCRQRCSCYINSEIGVAA